MEYNSSIFVLCIFESNKLLSYTDSEFLFSAVNLRNFMEVSSYEVNRISIVRQNWKTINNYLFFETAAHAVAALELYNGYTRKPLLKVKRPIVNNFGEFHYTYIGANAHITAKGLPDIYIREIPYNEAADIASVLKNFTTSIFFY